MLGTQIHENLNFIWQAESSSVFVIVIPHVGEKIPFEGFINFCINGRASPVLSLPALRRGWLTSRCSLHLSLFEKVLIVLHANEEIWFLPIIYS